MKSHEQLEILPLEEKDRGVASYLLIYSILGELDVDIKKIEQASLAIKDGLIIKKFYKALSDNKITGLISLSDARSGFMELEYSSVKKEYGLFRARKVYDALKNIFSINCIENGGGYITFPISPEGDSSFVAISLLEYVLSLDKYERYYILIKSNDTERRKLLEEIGFHEYKLYDKNKNVVSASADKYYILMEY